MTSPNIHPQKIIGLLPAAGQGSRLSPLPMSKELFPIGFQDLAGKGLRPKVACQYLLESNRSLPPPNKRVLKLRTQDKK